MKQKRRNQNKTGENQLNVRSTALSQLLILRVPMFLKMSSSSNPNESLV
jgi:hypothetical protein